MNRIAQVFAFVAAIVLPQASAHANGDRFQVKLDGLGSLAPTRSTAKGTAKLTLNRESQTLTMKLRVTGMTIDKLWDQLVAAPIGPIHFHKYAKSPDVHNHATNAVALLLPVPYSSAYSATKNGFTVTLKDFSVAKSVALIGSKITYDQFAAALDSGTVVLNIHTDKFNDGEISGTVTKRP